MESAGLLPVWCKPVGLGAAGPPPPQQQQQQEQQERQVHHEFRKKKRKKKNSEEEAVEEIGQLPATCGRVVAGAVFLLVVVLGAVFLGHRMGRRAVNGRQALPSQRRGADAEVNAGAEAEMPLPCVPDAAPLSRVLAEMELMSDRFIFAHTNAAEDSEDSEEYWDVSRGFDAEN
jgi:hypothetical protein